MERRSIMVEVISYISIPRAFDTLGLEMIPFDPLGFRDDTHFFEKPTRSFAMMGVDDVFDLLGHHGGWCQSVKARRLLSSLSKKYQP
jgi:hypothetical protein